MSERVRIILLAASVALMACEGGGANRFLSLGTGGTGGIYYPLGGAIASRLSLAAPDRQFTAEVTGGSVENINRVVAGEVDLGFTMATNAFLSYEHGGTDSAGLRSLRLVAPLYPNLVHIVVTEGSTIQTIDDLRGRRVSVGSAGSGTEQVSRQLLGEYDLTYDDLEERFLSFRESADALRDGAVDAAIIAAGYPTSAVLEVATAGVIRFIPVTGVHRAAMIAAYPYYQDAVLPAGAYPGLAVDVPTVAVLNWIVGDATLDSSVVTLLLDVLDRDRVALGQVHRAARQIDLDALGRPTPIPVHEAALQWFEGRN